MMRFFANLPGCTLVDAATLKRSCLRAGQQASPHSLGNFCAPHSIRSRVRRHERLTLRLLLCADRGKPYHEEAALRLQARKRQNPYLHTQIGVSEFNLDDDLLSHGETPHYHRRCIVSLLSSGWDQVVPMLYGRQEILLPEGLVQTLQRIGYVTICGFFELSVQCVFTTTICAADCLGVIWSSLTGN